MRRILLLLLGMSMLLAACGTPTPAVIQAGIGILPGQGAPATPTTSLYFPPTAVPRATAAPASQKPQQVKPTAKPAKPVQPTPKPATPVPATPKPVEPAALSQATPNQPVRLVIDAIGLDRSLKSVGLDKNRIPIVPDHDIGWYNLSAGPGMGDNIVLWGHVLRFRQTPKIPAPFARLKEVEVGASVVLYDAEGGEHRYVVTQKIWATPDQVEYILPHGSERITMVSCIGDKVIQGKEVVEMSHRLITIAEPAP